MARTKVSGLSMHIISTISTACLLVAVVACLVVIAWVGRLSRSLACFRRASDRSVHCSVIRVIRASDPDPSVSVPTLSLHCHINPALPYLEMQQTLADTNSIHIYIYSKPLASLPEERLPVSNSPLNKLARVRPRLLVVSRSLTVSVLVPLLFVKFVATRRAPSCSSASSPSSVSFVRLPKTSRPTSASNLRLCLLSKRLARVSPCFLISKCIWHLLAYLVSLFEDTNLAAIHAKRVTMYVRSTLLCVLIWRPCLANPRISPSPVASVASALKFVHSILCTRLVCTWTFLVHRVLFLSVLSL
jgi:hypothetical protein